MCGFHIDRNVWNGGGLPCNDAAQPAVYSPAPHQPIPDAPDFWYGTEDLWTILRPGPWDALPRGEHGYRQKVWFWSKNFDWRKEYPVPLRVSGRRLDREAPTFEKVGGTNAIFDGAAMLTVIEVPTTGCWEITGSYHDHALKFVVKVEPESAAPRR